MTFMAKYLINELRHVNEVVLKSDIDLSKEYNSNVVLPYSSIEKEKLASIIVWHCDTSYNTKYDHFKRNVSVESTPVVILT